MQVTSTEPRVRTNNLAPDGFRGLDGKVIAKQTHKGQQMLVVHIPRLNGSWRFAESEVIYV